MVVSPNTNTHSCNHGAHTAAAHVHPTPVATLLRAKRSELVTASNATNNLRLSAASGAMQAEHVSALLWRRRSMSPCWTAASKFGHDAEAALVAIACTALDAQLVASGVLLSDREGLAATPDAIATAPDGSTVAIECKVIGIGACWRSKPLARATVQPLLELSIEELAGGQLDRALSCCHGFFWQIATQCCVIADRGGGPTTGVLAIWFVK